MIRRILLVVWLFCCSLSALAVDRTKFRTCQQTSFCRRNRQHPDATPHASNALYHYKVLRESVHFHLPTEMDQENNEKEAQQSESVWKSLQRRLLSSSTDANDKDPVGPPPTLTATLQNTAQPTEFLSLSITALQDGMARLQVTEVYGSTPAVQQPRVRYDHLILQPDQPPKAAHQAVWLAQADPDKDPVWKNVQMESGKPENYMGLHFTDEPTSSDDSSTGTLVVLQLEPFVMTLYRVNQMEAGPLLELNGNDLMHFEIRRGRNEKQVPPQEKDEADQQQQQDNDEPKEEKEIVGYWEDGLAIYADGTREEKKEAKPDQDDRRLTEEEKEEEEEESTVELDPHGLWEEDFSGHKDSKPHGPMSVGMDMTFFNSQHLYGIPEHASSATLQTTRGDGAHYKEPYRLYNLDVFEYELDETMALYGSIPFVVSQSTQTGSVGVFWSNPTETFVDVTQQPGKSTSTHWISESGVLDLFLLSGPDPPALYRQYARLTGTTPLPPLFSLGYHQCRWNYKDEKDVYQVHGKFEELDYPYDVLWLDIEHTDGKRYFTWDKGLFPNPKEMQEKLAAQGRRMVTIVDPHMKRDNNYYIHKEATAKGLYIKDKDGKKDFDGWCWPGSSSYLDFTAGHVRSWWADQFSFDRYEGSTPSLFTWNDMNEPSVFNGPEVSMSKDLKNLKGEEHREWHNIYGMLFQRATAEGLIRRSGGELRPFVLSRAFFAGSQKYGAIWTGDNTAEWGHMEVAAPMLLSMNAAALTFVGADVGGFFGDPDAELFTRWMQAGAYQPFFRGHAHHDSKRREPWTYEDEVTLPRLRKAAMARYALLPFWYTTFYHNEVTGMPVMRMMWMEYPNTPELYSVDDQYLVGSDLLVKPIAQPGVTTASVLFPTDHIWYDAETLALVSDTITAKAVLSKDVPADIDTIPVFQRGGSILPRKLRLRRSSMLMKHDPYTLYVALDPNQQASGDLYMDDEESFGYRKKQEFALTRFAADLNSGTISSSVTIGAGWSDFSDSLAADRMVERIIVMGVSAAPKQITVNGMTIESSYDKGAKILVLRKPEVSAMAEWTITFS